MNFKGRVADLASLPVAERAEAVLQAALEYGALPTTTRTLLQLTRRDNAEVGPVVDELGLNPSLTAAVLRVANSTQYGQTRSVADLGRAVSLIGMQELHDIVAGSAMMSAFSVPDPLSKQIQETAALSAALAQHVAVQLKISSTSAAYLSGLMCELGALACLALDPEFARFHVAAGDAVQRFAVETSRYGTSTAAIGGRILAASSLPTAVAEAVATTGLEPGEHKASLGRVVAFSRLAVRVLLSAAEHGSSSTLLNELTETAVTVGLEADAEMLMQTCLSAAAAAELRLRGELGIAPTMSLGGTTPAANVPLKHKTWWKRIWRRVVGGT